MKGTIALAAALVVVLGGLGLGHATARPDPKQPPVIIGEETVEERLDRMQRQINAQQLQITAVRNQNETLRAQVSNLIAINQHVSMVSLHGRPTVRFTGVNVQVVNGSGQTNTANGTGNLILGYDRLRADTGEEIFEEECSSGWNLHDDLNRTKQECEAVGGVWRLDHKRGSHYLVIGDAHNYSQWSGIISGNGSSTSGPFASVTGGTYNRVTSYGASVSGGVFGIASGAQSSVSGGYENWAAGYGSSVSGGLSGVARGSESSVSGGYANEASGNLSSVSGGAANEATNDGASVSGGALNKATGYRSSVSGGVSRTADQVHGWVAGN